VAGEERTEQEEAALQEDEAEMMARLQDEIRNLPVGDHLLYMLHSLSALAVGRLGLTADTAAHRDLDQARLAIDAFKALVGVLEPVRPPGEMAAHRGMLSQLQLTYAGATRGEARPETVETPAEAAGVPQEAAEAQPEVTEAPAAAETSDDGAEASAKPARRKPQKPRRSSQTG
jgi:hypothetical protein